MARKSPFWQTRQTVPPAFWALWDTESVAETRPQGPVGLPQLLTGSSEVKNGPKVAVPANASDCSVGFLGLVGH